MNMCPLISVIIPVYNAESLVNRCIDSILNQTYTNWELLLINDGSTDDSGRICNEYSVRDNRIRVFHKKNGGVSSARNMGIDNAKGEWITFVDSDDFLNLDALFNLVSAIGNSDIVLSSIREYNKISYKDYIIHNIATKNVQETANWLDKLNFLIVLVTPVCKLLKTSIINNHKLRFDIRFCSGEDSLFIYQYLYYIERVSCINKISYNYMNERGLSIRLLSLKEIDGILQEITLILEKLSERFHMIFSHCYYNSLEYFIMRYDFSNKSIKQFYEDLLFFSRQKYFKDLANDKTYIPKGKNRKLFDFLLNHKLYIILVLWVYKGKKLYF